MDNLGINQANSILKVTGTLRERVWQLCGLQYAQIRINTNTTVKTVYGNQQGARKGHNTQFRGESSAFRSSSHQDHYLTWKRSLQEGEADIFGKSQKSRKQVDTKIDKLHRQIGQLLRGTKVHRH